MENTKPAISENTKFWYALGLCFIRVATMAIGFVLTAIAIFAATGVSFTDAWQITGDHRDVVATYASNIPCFFIIVWLCRKEGITVKQIMGIDEKWKRDVLLGIPMFGLYMLAGGVFPLVEYFIAAPYPPNLTQPSMWVVVWIATLFAITNAPVEEVIFRSYGLPRMEKKIGLVTTMVVTSSFAALFHLFLPPLGSPEVLLARFVTFFILFFYCSILFLLFKRRILPLIVGHFLLNSLYLSYNAYMEMTTG